MSGSGGWIDRQETAALAVFAAASLLLLVAIASDLRPLPLYPDQTAHPDVPAVFVTSRFSLEMRLALPAAAERIRVPVWTDESRSPLEVVLTLAADEKSPSGYAQRTLIGTSGLASVDIPVLADDGGVVRLDFSSKGDSRETSPRLVWSDSAPGNGVQVRYAGQPLAQIEVLPDTGPLVLVEYRWPTRWLLALWLLPLAGLALLARNPRYWIGFVVVLALAASVTSALLWQRDYSRRAVHYDADQYAKSASMLSRYVTDPAQRASVRSWLRQHPNSTTLAVPAVLAIPVALGVPVEVAFMVLCALAGLLTLLVMRRTLHEDLDLEDGLAWLVVAAFACHPIVLRSFARPTTDGVGLLLVVLTLAVLVRRFDRADRRSDLFLALLLLMHPLVRPQGLGYWPFIAAAVLAADAARSGKWPSFASLLRTGLVLFAFPIAVLAVLYLSFDWQHNVELMLAKASHFRVNSTWRHFLISLVGCVQLLPLLWWSARGRLREPRVLLFAAWGAYAILLLVVVQAPYWLRHFEPALPVAFVLTGVGLGALEGRKRQLGVALLAVLAAAGVAVTLWQVLSMAALPGWLAGFVRSP